MTRLAVFDCDGTLVDSQANICRALEEACATFRIDVPERAAIRRIVGLSLVEAMTALLPAGDAKLHHALAEEYKLAFQRLRRDGSLDDEPLFDGIAEAIEVLVADGWILGVATGKSDRGLAHVLDRHGIAHRFVTLQTADRHPSKPHPAMLAAAMAEAGARAEATVMIGDTSFDIEMARAAGVRAIGVSWGYHAADELFDAGADVVIDQATDLPRRIIA